ncbi:MAG: ABC transporter permease [Patescibacteria group bacterium]|nr:ABC transporter permease [Patescibacteria group bacterium]
MVWKHTLKTSFTGLSTNRSRSMLTILGIVIGITAIMLVISVGAGAQKFILGQVQGLGSKTIAIIPGRQPTGPSDFANVFLNSLKERDLQSLKNKSNLPHASDVMPVMFGPVRLAYGNQTYQSTVLGGGSSDENNIIGNIFDIYPSIGDFFSTNDVQSRASVVVIGDKVKNKLFDPGINPLGEKIKINNKSFRIVGILASKGQVSFFNFDDMVLIPYTTAESYVLGRTYFDRIIVTADSDNTVSQTVNDITTTLRNNHNIDDPTKDDFFVQTQVDLSARIATITNALTLFLVAMASIALFVGGVGIMNIMLVSVTERTREIGLRKALGATNRDILSQFLLEAVLLTAIGGVIGIILGAFLSFGIAIGLSNGLGVNWQFVFPWNGAFLGLGVSALIGLVFGGYPASQASRKSPIEALRYE